MNKSSCGGKIAREESWEIFSKYNCLLIIQILFSYEVSRNSVMLDLHDFFSAQQFLCLRCMN